MNESTKWVLSGITLIVGSSSLPITGGASFAGVIAALFAIWGIDYDN